MTHNRLSFDRLLAQAHQHRRVILMDGALGTMLLQLGLNMHSQATFEWNRDYPDRVQQVHRHYYHAGAIIHSANSFACHLPLAATRALNLQILRERYSQAAAVVGQCLPDNVYILGCVGTLQAHSIAYARMMGQALSSCPSFDAVLLETQTNLATVENWAEGFLSECRLPLLISFIPMLSDRSEVAPDVIAQWAEANADRILALGVNCGPNPALSVYTEVLQRYRRMTQLPLFVRPSISASPGSFGWAAAIEAWHQAGACMIGGCCGTEPMDIARMYQYLRDQDLLVQG